MHDLRQHGLDLRVPVMGRRNWLRLGIKEVDPKVAAIFSVVESSRRLDIPIRRDLTDVPPRPAYRSRKTLAELTPTDYPAKNAE